MKRSYLCVTILLSMNIYAFGGAPWQRLFNGKDLSGWKIRDGQAKFYVQDNMIVGKTVLGQANSFLCTDKDYGDFILEFEMKIDDGLNSGIQIRSESREDYKNGRVHGYQVECDTTRQIGTGGIYDELRRGWLYKMQNNPTGQNAFKVSGWNKFRVEATGSRIRTFINDVPCADLIDNMTEKGFIGLQVHSIKKRELAGKKVCWRKLRIKTEGLGQGISKEYPDMVQVNMIPNYLSDKEKQIGWNLLFNGKNLSGWKIRDGKAPFFVENGAIAGQTVDGPSNTFLCTEQEYGDFILEFEIKIDEGLNSGVQTRSLSREDYRNGQVHGYQVECDSSDRAWSGSILDEARRGWLYCVERNPGARIAFKKGKWNKFKVEAYGNNIRTFVNGIECVDMIDDMTSKGFIGLQVHRIGSRKELIGRKVRWRNLKILTSNVKEHLSEMNHSVPQVNLIPNTLSEKEQKQGWKLLWDGKTASGWRKANLESFPGKGWKIQDGELIVVASGGDDSLRGGDIVTEKKFKNFELQVEFKHTPGANSGIKYFVNPQFYEGKGSTIGCEYQILDDDYYPDDKKGLKGNRTLASLFDLIPAENDYGKKVKKYDWNRAWIIVKGNHVEHWLNNMKMVEYKRGTQMWRALVAKSKYHVWPNFGEAEQGHILLQDNGDEVHFRSIKIKELD